MAQTTSVALSPAGMRTVKAMNKAYFAALKASPEAERAMIDREAIMSIEAGRREAREKIAAAKSKAKAKTDAAAAKLKAKPRVKAAAKDKAKLKVKAKRARKPAIKAAMPAAPTVPANGTYPDAAA